MRKFLGCIFVFLQINLGYSQYKFTYEPFEFIDYIDSISPFSGNYERRLNNVILETGKFHNGKMIGNWKSFSIDGKLVKDIHYLEGVLDSTYLTYHYNGTIKLSGRFLRGVRQGLWEYFNAEGKRIWTVTYDHGKPIGTSDYYDQRGKQIKCSFNHDAHKFDKKTSSYLMNEQGVCEVPQTGEWFFYWDPKPIEFNKAHGFDRKSLEAELIRNNLDLPVELFNTYFKQHYLIQVKYENYACIGVQVLTDYDRNQDYGLLDFIAQTNDIDKLKHPETNDLSLLLLKSKIENVFNCFQPWSLENGELQFVFLFNLNDFE